MANNVDLIGDEATLLQLISGDFSATDGAFEDEHTTSLKNWAFTDLSNLRSLVLKKITYIKGTSICSGCTSLQYVSMPELERVDGVTEFFLKCTSLRDVNFPKLRRWSSNNTSVFRYCGMEKIILPITEGYYGQLTFANCPNLTFADVGSPSRLESRTFNASSSLVAVILRKSDAITALGNVDAFGSTKYATSGAGGAYVYVPRDLIPTYKAATNWATLYAAHPDMFRPLEDYTVDGTTTGEFDESMIATPQTPLYAVTNEDVSPDANHQRTITTTAEGHITYTAGTQTSEAYSNVYINNTSVSTSLGNSFFTIPTGSTVKVIIQNMTATHWSSVSGVRNNIAIQFKKGSTNAFIINWGDLLQTFQTDGLRRYEQTFTNSSGSDIAIKGINLYGILSSNNVVDFTMKVFIDGVRYV